MTMKEQLLAAASKRRSDEVEIDGQKFRLAEMSAAQSDALMTAWEEDRKKDKGGAEFNYQRSLRLLMQCIVDENGAAIFKEADMPELLAFSRTAVDKLAAAALKVNGWGGGEEEKASKN